MPHFGLMNTEDSFKSEEGALLRARLHIRAGRRRLRQGKIASGIVTLYDALLFAMESYIMSPRRWEGLDIREGEDLKNDRTLYAVLTRSGVLDGKFDYEAFDRLIGEEAVEEMPGYDYKWILEGVESVMTQLGVMPFDETALPQEDPKTF